jgi:Fic family protein
MYIHQLADWPRFRWDRGGMAAELAAVRHHQGRLLGRMEGLGFQLRAEAVLRSLTEEVLKSSEIEGEHLDRDQVRSSLARRLGMDIGALPREDRSVEGVVEMMLDAARNFRAPLTEERLYGWHGALFPTGRSGLRRITVGAWRTAESGPMQVVSGPLGRERIHFEAPEAGRLPPEMRLFLDWFNAPGAEDPVILAAIAHLWFVTVHPFEDGNGRIARAIADMALARSEGTEQRFYSMSSQIRAERNEYYDKLERTQKGELDITGWISWFLGCLDRAFIGAETLLASVLRKARFWDAHAGDPLNDRQRKVVNRLLDGFEGKLSSSKYAALAKCSQDTAARDIDDLQEKAILVRDPAGGRSTRYSLVADSADALGALARWIESQADKAGGAERAVPLRALSQDVRDRAGSADGKKFQVWLSALATLEAQPEDRLVSLVARVLEADVTRLGAAGGKD